MPTYQDALAAEPSEFLGYASEMTAAAADLATHQSDYGEQVARINANWKDAANDAFNGEVANVNAHIGKVIGEVTAAAGGLSATGAQMVAQCAALKVADAAINAAGFDVQPAPLVTLGMVQRVAIAAAGPFGPLVEAALQAQAAAGTMGLQALLSLVNAADAAAGAALTQAAELLRPLEDKSGAGDENRDLHKPAGDHSTGEGAGEEEEPSEEDEEEGEEEPEPEEAAQEEQPSAEQPGMEQPETPAGMDDFERPETPEFDDPWSTAELPDPEAYEGGLASGGGLGGGLGAGGGLGGLAAGTGTVNPGALGGGGAGVPVGAGTAAGATGAKAGVAGGMVGGAGRGAGSKTDDEAERETWLTEDPDEDVWGIGKHQDEDNPYA